jgi:eukaryotic-like serine/threonine-protein kinase
MPATSVGSADGAISGPAGSGGTEVAGDHGGIRATEVEQAADDDGAAGAVSPGAEHAGAGERGAGLADQPEVGDGAPSGGEEPGAGPARSLASLAGSIRLGERMSVRRTPVVVAVVAVVVLIVVAAWAAAGDGGGNEGGTGGGARDASTTTTTADGEASQTTATTAASTTTSTPTTAAGGVPRGWTRYEGPNGVYTIAHPAGWQVQPGEQGRVRIRDPESSSYLLIDWTNEPRPDPVADWRTQSQGFAERHEAYQEISIAPFRYRDYNAAVWEFRYRDQGVDLHVANLGFVAGNRGYALYFQTHEDKWASSQSTFERFRQTFHPG